MKFFNSIQLQRHRNIVNQKTLFVSILQIAKTQKITNQNNIICFNSIYTIADLYKAKIIMNQNRVICF